MTTTSRFKTFLLFSTLAFTGCATTQCEPNDGILDEVKIISQDRNLPVATKVRDTINKACGYFDGNIAEVSNWYGTDYGTAISNLNKVKSQIESVNSKARVLSNSFDDDRTEKYNRQYQETVLAFENVKSELLVPLRDIKPPAVFSTNGDEKIYKYQNNHKILEENYKELNKLIPGSENAFISSLPAILAFAIDIFTTGKQQCNKNLAYVLAPQRDEIMSLSLPADAWVLPVNPNETVNEN